MGTRMKETRIDIAVGGDRGLTLVELLVAVAIGTAIIGAVSMAIMSIMKITPLNNDRAVVLRQVQNAGHWVSLDVLGASSVMPQPEPGVLVRLQKKEGYPVVTRQVEYVFNDTTLRRRVDGEVPGMLIAQYVVTADTSFAVSGNSTYRLTVKASKGAATLQRTYDVMRRSVD